MATMSSVCEEYRYSKLAYFVVPLIGGFISNLTYAIAITMFMNIAAGKLYHNKNPFGRGFGSKRLRFDQDAPGGKTAAGALWRTNQSDTRRPSWTCIPLALTWVPPRPNA